MVRLLLTLRFAWVLLRHKYSVGIQMRRCRRFFHTNDVQFLVMNIMDIWNDLKKQKAKIFHLSNRFVYCYMSSILFQHYLFHSFRLNQSKKFTCESLISNKDNVIRIYKVKLMFLIIFLQMPFSYEWRNIVNKSYVKVLTYRLQILKLEISFRVS